MMNFALMTDEFILAGLLVAVLFLDFVSTRKKALQGPSFP